MASEKITLSIPEQILKELKKEKQDYGYSSLQAVIIDNLREKYFKKLREKETRGRPNKFDAVKFLTSKRRMFE